jgi:predicted nucleic acid-binding protein
MTWILIDSGAFIALIDEPDRHHNDAVAIYDDLVRHKARLVTTNHVVGETCT